MCLIMNFFGGYGAEFLMGDAAVVTPGNRPRRCLFLVDCTGSDVILLICFFVTIFC